MKPGSGGEQVPFPLPGPIDASRDEAVGGPEETGEEPPLLLVGREFLVEVCDVFWN